MRTNPTPTAPAGPSPPEDAADLLCGRYGSRPPAVAALLLLALLAPALPAAAQDLDTAARHQMVEEQLRQRGIQDERVLATMVEVPRHAFVPPAYRSQAYDDRAIPIGHSQSIHQPWLVAYMTELLELKKGDRVLEIGTGSGYHTAVLSRLALRVYTMEIVPDFGRRAAERFDELGYRNIETRVGDGYQGWPEEAPFDAILLTAAPPEIPAALRDQLDVGGRLVAPVGSGPIQELQVLRRTRQDFEVEFRDPLMVTPLLRRDLP